MSKINSKKGKAKISLLTCILYLLFICFNIVATNYNITAMAASVYKFDFGSESSPVASGYTKVSNTMVYNSSRGYGLNTSVDYRDRGNPDDLRRDFVIYSSFSFMVDLPNGTYDVKLITGDAIAFNRTSVTIEGVSYGNMTSSSGGFAENQVPLGKWKI